VDDECKKRTCNAGVCGFSFTAASTPVAQQAVGDCKVNVCDGNGNVVSATDNNDKPVDNNSCTQDVCTNGVPSNPNVVAGTKCGLNQVCDGAGQCVGCIAASDCPGVDDECKKRTCNAGVCGFSFTAASTPVTQQKLGDCKANVCDGNGNIVSIADNNDKPADDGNQCTAQECSNGSPAFPPLPPNTACNQNGGSLCSNSGTCVQCNVASDCPGVDTDCKKRTCNAGVCGSTFVAANTPAGPQTAGDCRVNVCDGNGNIVSVTDSNDKPVDNLDCTKDLCSTNGLPSNPNEPIGVGCDDDGGNVCNGNGACIKTFMVLRLGNGAAPLTNAATAGFVEEYTLDGNLFAVPNNPIPLPAGGSLGGNRITFSGTATSEGNLSISLNGKFVVLGGYDADAGTPTVASSPSTVVKRVIGRIDRQHNVDASTKLDTAFSGSNIRSACTTDGKQLWATGTGNSTGGVWSTTFGTSGPGVQVVSAPSNVRFCHVFFNQFFGTTSTASPSPLYSVFQTTDKLPLAAPQNAQTLAGLPMTSGPSPYSFVMLDSDDNGIPDLLYIADDRTDNSGGVYKWVSTDGINWTAGAPALIAVEVATGVRGLAGFVQKKKVTLLASSALSNNNNPNTIFKIEDDLLSGVPTVSKLVVAELSTVFRGVTMSPR
jgi:hypothetical protein